MMTLLEHRVSLYEQTSAELAKLEKWQNESGIGFHHATCENPYISKYETWEGVYMNLGRILRINPLFGLTLAHSLDRRVRKLQHNIECAVKAITSWRIA